MFNNLHYKPFASSTVDRDKDVVGFGKSRAESLAERGQRNVQDHKHRKAKKCLAAKALRGKRKRSASSRDRIAGLASHLGSLASTSGSNNLSGHSAGSRGQSKRLRSRNKVVDEWLNEEGGDDAYADLEDFLVA